MSNENMQFPIPNSILEPYIKSAVSAAIVASLGDGTKVIEQAVQAALMTKVSEKGVISNYSSENKYNLVEILAKNKIIEITKETIHEMAEQMRPTIRAQVEKQIKAKTNKFSDALVDGCIGSLKASWAINVGFETPKRD